jgi:hypothetical protein
LDRPSLLHDWTDAGDVQIRVFGHRADPGNKLLDEVGRTLSPQEAADALLQKLVTCTMIQIRRMDRLEIEPKLGHQFAKKMLSLCAGEIPSTLSYSMNFDAKTRILTITPDWKTWKRRERI